MPQALNLQRNTEVFMSTVDLSASGTAADMTPRNTWKVEVLAGYAASQSSATQDITSMESGVTPDRSTQRFNTAINPVEWSFQTYLRPTGVVNNDGVTVAGMDRNSGNTQPLADWFLWQSLMSNAAWATGSGGSSQLRSAWQNNATFVLAERNGAANVVPHKSNYASANEYQLYLKMDNVVYQIKNASVNEASVDAAIDGIATTSWSGFGTTMVELPTAARTEAVTVFGGVISAALTATANSSVDANTQARAYHAWGRYNVNGTTTTSAFIKNRLSSIILEHTPSGGAKDTYTLAVTGLGFTYSNALTFLTPEELATLNTPIGQFTGAKTITGNFTAYLRAGDDDTAQFLKNIVTDSRVQHAQVANANLRIGGNTAPYVAVWMPATQFNFPTHAVEDIIGISVEFLAQEPTATKGTGSELSLFVSSNQ